METDLENLSSLVAEHRRVHGRGQYPATVWDGVSVLRKQHTVEEISKAIGINAITIYRKTSRRRRRPLFREVKLSPPPMPLQRVPLSAKPVVVEMRRGDGTALRIRIEASSQELSGLVSEFLR